MTVTLTADSGYDDESVYVIHQISGGDYEGVNAGFVFIKVLDPKPAVEALAHRDSPTRGRYFPVHGEAAFEAYRQHLHASSLP